MFHRADQVTDIAAGSQFIVSAFAGQQWPGPTFSPTDIRGSPHVISQSRRIGTALNPSPKPTLASPSYSTTPEVKRLPAASLSFRRPRKSLAVTVAAAFT